MKDEGSMTKNRTMTGKEFATIMAKLGFVTQSEQAELLGIGGRTVRSYLGGRSKIPAPTAILLRLMLGGRVKRGHINMVR